MNLTETFNSLGAAEIAAFVEMGQEENLHLDFKTVPDAAMTNREDRRRFAVCLSGFANSSGGLIVWGVDARKNKNNIDCAQKTVEIEQVRLFLTRLNQYTGQATDPIIDGVRHKVIETTGDRGFAVTLVPESDSGPYMAKSGEDRYYKRSGDSFYRMEHFDLEDMFGRRQKPVLSVKLIPKITDPGEEHLSFLILNNGRGIAKHVGFVANLQNVKIVGNTHDGLQMPRFDFDQDRPTISYDNSIGVVHPNNVAMYAGFIKLRRPDPSADIIVDVSLYCENARTQTGRITVPPLSRGSETVEPPPTDKQ